MTDDDLPVLPGFREMARSARARASSSEPAEPGAEPADLLAGLAAELVVTRRAAGLSQADVADRMGTSQPAVARVEAGGVDVRLSTLRRYAAAVGCRLELRLTRDETRADLRSDDGSTPA